MSGFRRLTTRESRQAADRSTSVRGAMGIEIEAFGGPRPELAAWMRDERRATADFAQAENGQQNLILPAAPCARRIDME